MDIRALRNFLLIAELGSLSRAAQRLHISQPALSRQLHRLEAELERPLFERHGHGVALTTAGRRLMERGQQILAQLEQTTEEVREAGSEPAGSLTLAVPPAAGVFLVPALAARLSRDHPRIVLKIVAGYSSYISDWLTRGLVDLACVHDPSPQRGFEIIPLLREEVFVVGRRDVIGSIHRSIGPEALVRLPLVLPSRPNASRRLLDQWLNRRAQQIDVRLEIDDTAIIRAILRSGTGVSLLSHGSFQQELRHGELTAVPLRPRAYWPLAIVRPLTARRAMVANLAVTLIKDAAEDMMRAGTWPGARNPAD